MLKPSGSKALLAFTGTTVVGRMVLRVWRPFRFMACVIARGFGKP